MTAGGNAAPAPEGGSVYAYSPGSHSPLHTYVRDDCRFEKADTDQVMDEKDMFVILFWRAEP